MPLASEATTSRDVDELLRGPGPRLSLEPIIHLQTRNEVGAEALARFDNSLPTDAVFRLAHGEGVGTDLELRCLYRVLEHLQTVDPTDRCFIAVNLSPATFIDQRCFELIQRYPCDRLVMELTDHTAAPEIGVLRRYIDQARDHQIRIGVHVANRIDHEFFALIRPDIAKVRGPSSAWDSHDDDRAALVRYLSHLGAFVVAVGVSSTDAFIDLQQHGIDAAQGRMIGRTRTVDD